MFSSKSKDSTSLLAFPVLSVTLSVSMTVACQREIGQLEPSHNDVI